jgi:hypothetical protein
MCGSEDGSLPHSSRSSWSRCAGNLLSEDLVHDLRASGQGRHDLVSVDQLGGGGLIMSSEQRDGFDLARLAGFEPATRCLEGTL